MLNLENYKEKAMRTAATIIILAVLTIITAIVIAVTWLWLGLSLGIIALLYFVYNGFLKIPEEPPHKGVLVFCGKRQDKILDEGFHFFPIYPILFDVVMVDVTKRNQDLEEQRVRTPDRAEIAIKVSITWTPCTGESRNLARLQDPAKPRHLLFDFLNSGGDEGIRSILHDIIRDRLRNWAMSGEEGPADWVEAMGSGDEAIAVLLKAILGDELERIPSGVPTPILLKYFALPQKPPLENEKKKWGEGWEKVENEVSKLSPDQKDELIRAIERRRALIQEARQGNGSFVKESLGITINRFTVNEIIVVGEVAEAAGLQAREEHQRTAEEVEIRHLVKQVQKVRDELGVGPEQAIEAIQTERGKVNKQINEGKLNISPETREVLRAALSQLASFLLPKKQ